VSSGWTTPGRLECRCVCPPRRLDSVSGRELQLQFGQFVPLCVCSVALGYGEQLVESTAQLAILLLAVRVVHGRECPRAESVVPIAPGNRSWRCAPGCLGTGPQLVLLRCHGRESAEPAEAFGFRLSVRLAVCNPENMLLELFASSRGRAQSASRRFRLAVGISP
jgi:hypothetical protein